MIIKRRYTANFTTIGNELFADERLAADEVGILAYLRSLPHDWEVRRPALQRRWKMGREAIKRVITNLVRTGWCVARKDRLPNGTFIMIYEIRDEPGPTLTDEEVRRALSLVSSEAAPADPPLAHKHIQNTNSPRTDSIQTGGGAEARAGSTISQQANELAEQLLVIAGHNPKFWPPGWCGAPMRVQTWLSNGWQPEIIVVAARRRMARRDGVTPDSVRFFEKIIAEEIAAQAAPLPIVNVREAEKLTVNRHRTYGRQSGSLIAAIDRQLAEIEAADRADLAQPTGDLLRLPAGPVRGS